MKHRGRSGYSLTEIVIVIGIMALLLSLVMARFNYYKNRQAGRSACEVMMADIRLMQQMAFTLEREQKIVIAPGRNNYRYKVIGSEPGTLQRIVDFRNLFSASVCFAPDQEDTELIFYPWTARSADEWSVVQKNGVSDIRIVGGDVTYTIHIAPDGKLSMND